MRSSRHAYDAWHSALGVDAEADTPWHRMVRDAAADRRAGRVLEIGCGRGGFSVWLARALGGTVVAADFSPAAVRAAHGFARERGARNACYTVADIQWLPHPDGAFDTVISCETIEHVPDPARAVRELARVLKPGGLLLLTTPNYLGPIGLYRAYRRLVGRPFTEEGQPINNLVMLPRTLGWVRAAGLRVRRVDGVEHLLPFPGRPPLRMDWLERIRPLTKWIALQSFVAAEKPRA